MDEQMKSPLAFLYAREGEPTQRRVVSNWHERPQHIDGYCNSSKAPRSFRKDRIRSWESGAEQLISPEAVPSDAVSGGSRPGKIAAPEVLFTGFKDEKKRALRALAERAGMRVPTDTTKHLAYLVVFDRRKSPGKVERAIEAGSLILSEEQFLRMIETGEVDL